MLGHVDNGMVQNAARDLVMYVVLIKRDHVGYKDFLKVPDDDKEFAIYEKV